MNSDERTISLFETSRQLRGQPPWQSGVPFFRENWNRKHMITHQGVGAAARTVREAREGTVRPGDVVYIWAFNRTTTQLCKFEAKDLDSKSKSIRRQYKNILHGEGGGETCLYDAVVEALKFQIVEENNRSTVDAGCFLVPFTNGMDNSSKKSLESTMLQIRGAPIKRLHIIFVTANLPQNSPLKEELQAADSVRALIEYETSKAEDMSRATVYEVRDFRDALNQLRLG
ncbi:unnamed protein product [Sphagnum tenellum]